MRLSKSTAVVVLLFLSSFILQEPVKNGLEVIYNEVDTTYQDWDLKLLVTSKVLLQAKTEPLVTDKSTVFHRIYVLGNTSSEFENEAMIDNSDKLIKALETEDNQAPGSTNLILKRPTTRHILTTAMNNLKQKAKSGEVVTFYYIGHGGRYKFWDRNGEEPDIYDEHIRINNIQRITDDELAKLLSGFRKGVMLVVILDTCFGGEFTDGAGDLKESNQLAFIAPILRSPIDLPGIKGEYIQTLTEDIAVGVGNGIADLNRDEKITATELKKWLRENENQWKLSYTENKPDRNWFSPIDMDVSLNIDRRKSNEIPKDIVSEDFTGVLVADFFSAYKSLSYHHQKHFVRPLRETISLPKKRGGEITQFHRKVRKFSRDSSKFRRLEPP